MRAKKEQDKAEYQELNESIEMIEQVTSIKDALGECPLDDTLSFTLSDLGAVLKKRGVSI